MSRILALFVGGLSGLLMAVQGAMNAGAAKTIGLWEASFVVHSLGTVVSVAALLLAQKGLGGLQHIGEAPWYFYLGGPVGVAIVYAVMVAVNRVGMVNATTAIVAAQLLTAAVVDHFGLFAAEQISFRWFKIIGVVLIAIGARILLAK